MFEVADTYELLDGLIENESQKRSVERFPYWAEVWPSSIGLAKWFNENQKKIIQPDGWVRELGCGVGLVGISLAVMGWSVEATDYVADALVFSAENAKVNQIANKHRVAYLDWRNPVGEICNCMVGSDIIYEKRNHLLIIRLIESQLASGGDLYLSDPKRVASRGFVDLLIKNGYRHSIDSINVKHGSLNNAIDIHHFVKP
tara:strand:+ start:4025 stop:4627 length:603 start_codon:yes stop_codon:yes gene_type:complete